ncbi:hypothetical protein GCM10009727_13410 [Actinomadura napierensis]|uniref:Uncharacterized protein n=1 Tax=Actinomadura napierensis TaxID=267854 RepID=A0ABN2YCN1_9ACTN
MALRLWQATTPGGEPGWFQNGASRAAPEYITSNTGPGGRAGAQ